VVQETEHIIDGCKSNNRAAQEALYRQYYGYAMSICLLYSKDRTEAEEIANDGFMKIFTRIAQYSPELAFKSWIRRIFINSAIDYFRKHKKHYGQADINEITEPENFDENVLDKLSAEEIMRAVQSLSPVYQMVFNLYVKEGYKHNEIAEQLGITEATSRSNLAKARNKLKETLHYLSNYN